MMLPVVLDVIGWIGVVVYLLAYYLVSVGRVNGQSRVYQWMNLGAAIAVGGNALYYGALPSVAVNVVWFGIAIASLSGLLRPANTE